MVSQRSWRTAAFVMAAIMAGLWAIVSGLRVSEAWPVRGALARVELAREETACGNRTASPANQQRCRDLAEVMNRADQAEAYFLDGLVVFGPPALLLGVGLWFRRRAKSRKVPSGHGRPRRPFAA